MQNAVKHIRRKKQTLARKNGSEKSFTQAEAAQAIGVGRTRLSMIENGAVIPTVTELEGLADYLEVTPGHLFTPKQIDIIHDLAEGAL